MTKTFSVGDLEYTASNKRMRYNPEFCENHRKSYTKEDYIYMCSMWDTMKKLDIAMALGRTHSSVLSKVCVLKKIGIFDHYKKSGKQG